MFNEPKLTLTEYPDKHACESIYLHNDIWKNDKQKIFNYCNTIINDGKISIEYKKKGEYGRLYPSQYNTTYMWNKIRSTLFKNTDYDIDIVNCHPNIIKHIMETHYSGFPTPHLDNYINNRDEIIKQIKIKEDVIDKYNKLKDEYLSCKDVIKRLFIIILYGGGIETWTNTFNLQSDDYSLCDYVKDFQQNLAKEMVSKWNLDSEGARKIKAREMVQKFNTYTNTKNGGLNLTQEQKRIIIKSALKKEREV